MSITLYEFQVLSVIVTLMTIAIWIKLLSEYNNINSRLDATITNFIDNYNQLNMFRTIISPIPSCTNAPTVLPAGSTVGALYHSLVFLRMGEIIARNMLS